MSSVGGPYDSTNAGVPASVSTDGFDVSSSVAEAQARSEQYQKALTAAQVPVAQRTTPGLPSTMTRPIGPAPQTQGYAQPRSKGQAIANMITSAGNAVSKIVTAEKQHKQAQMVDVTTKFLQAQQLLSESQQQHDAATAAGNKEAAAAAQVQVDKNKAAIQTIVSDQKHLKMLSKGLNINYIDPSENKTEEHTAVQKAIEGVHGWNERRKAAEVARQQVQQKQQAEAPGKFLAAYDKQQPTQNTPNQYAQQQVALQQAQFKMLMEYRGKVEPAQIRAQAAVYERQTVTNTAIDRQLAQFAHVEHMADVHLANEYTTAMRNAGIQRRLAQQKRADAQGNPLLMFTADRKNALTYEHAAAQKATAIASLLAQRYALYYGSNGKPLSQDKIDPNDVKTLNWQITQLQQAQKNDLDLAKSYSDSADGLQKINGFKESEAIDESGSSASSSTDSSATEPLSAPGEPDDPNTYWETSEPPASNR